MRYALIRKSKVENVIIADAEFIKHLTSKYDYIENVDGKRAGPGCSYDPAKRIFGDPPPPPLPSLEEVKAQALAQLEANFQDRVKQPVFDTINICSWSGGSEAALLIDKDIRLAQQKGALTVDLRDTMGKVHTLTVADAQKVFVLVADTFCALHTKKITIAKAINAATTVNKLKNIAITLQEVSNVQVK